MSQPPKGIQDIIHTLEEGVGKSFIKKGMLLLLAIFIAVVYHLTEFRNFNNAEAMDMAQIGRNLAEGRGYTTDFIRPFAVQLLQKKADIARKEPSRILRQPLPDLSNPPLYPALLAGAMKVLPFKSKIPDGGADYVFLRYQPDELIALVNLALFLVIVIQVYLLGRSLFDPAVAAVAAAIVFGTELLWRFTYSGLSTILLIVLLLGIIQILVKLERGATAEPMDPENPLPSSESGMEAGSRPLASTTHLIVLAVLAGVLTGLAGITRYGALALVVPVTGCVFWWSGTRRWVLGAVTVAACTLVVAPWLARNHRLCGHYFGTAGYAVYQETPLFNDTRLERMQAPDFSKTEFGDFRRKFTLNATQLLTDEVPRLGGSYTTALFLVGLLIPFHKRVLQRIRWFVVACIISLLVAQALGRTHLTTAVPTVNSENLLVLLAPITILIGVSLFFMLLDRIEFLLPQFRTMTISGFVFVVCLPMVFTILPPRTYPVAYPPYHPQVLQTFAKFMKSGELMMSDMPWAVAWYGQRECIWTTLRVGQESSKNREDFFNIHDYQRPVHAVYLSPVTADAPWRPKFLNQTDMDVAWNRFYMDALLRTNMPTGFPLRHAYGAGYISAGHFFLTDLPRWNDWSLRPN